MLDERKAAILRAVVEEYIATAQPVGSSHVAAAPGVGVSPATVRNDMAVLEREGYLVQPHTSAGRIPTDQGYRYFVDQLREPGPLSPAQRQLVRDFFNRAHGELERVLHDTSRLLSDLTHYAGVVVAPPPEVATIRSVHLVTLSSRAALLVVVLSNGVVEKRSVDLTEDMGDEKVAAASAHLAAHLAGRTLTGPVKVPPTGDTVTDAVIGLAVDALASEPDAGTDHIYVGGAALVAQSFEAVDTVRRVLTVLEEQYLLVGLIRQLLDRGLSVAIGAEHGMESLAECSLIVAPYTVEGEHLGSVAVLGPTRMNYPAALAAVSVVSKRLAHVVGEPDDS